MRRRLDAPRERVWFALADRELRAAWWPDLDFEPAVGAPLTEYWAEGDASRDAVGEIDVLVAGHALGFGWRDRAEPQLTRVLISLVSDSGETVLSVAETGFDVFPDGAHRVRISHESWDAHLDDLAAALAAGLV